MKLLNFIIEPPILTPWLSDGERDKNIVLFDLQIDFEDEDKLRFDFDVAFNPISVRRGKVDRRDFYVGCTGAEIHFIISSGQIIEYTKGSKLDVKYENRRDFNRQTALNLIPKLKSKNKINEREVAPGSLTYKKSQYVSFSASFNSEERTLATIHLANTVKWHIKLPRGEKVIRDYLLGNIYLHAVCSCNTNDKSGKVIVRPSDVRFFGSDQRPLSWIKSVVMHYILYRKNIDIYNVDGIEARFKEIENEE